MCFQFTHFLCDDWENIYLLFLIIIIIKSEVWTITHCLGLGHETLAWAVCPSIFLLTDVTDVKSIFCELTPGKWHRPSFTTSQLRFWWYCCRHQAITWTTGDENPCHTVSLGINYWPLGFAAVHDGVIKWKHFPRYWPFVWGIHRSPVNSPHKAQWRGALVFSLTCVWINGWVNSREAGDLSRYRADYDVTVM